MAQNIIYQSEILDLVFATKNKEYGAYILRKLYDKHVSIALLAAIILFSLFVSSPLIVKYFTPKEAPVQILKKTVDVSTLGEPPSIDKNQAPPPKVEAPPPLTTTIKFLPPVIKKDAEVAEEYIPTQAELKNVDVGKKTQEGDPNGVNYDLIEVEQTKKVVVEEKKAAPKAEVYTFVEVMPTFPGGDEALLSYLASNIKYPEIAKRASVEGRVIVQFIVSKSGAISEVNVVKGIGAGCDEEAIRVIKGMPGWKPGKQNGMPVNVKISVPINFRLQ
jgi:periplasmic protein TonB